MDNMPNPTDAIAVLQTEIDSEQSDFRRENNNLTSKSAGNAADDVVDNANKYFLIKILSPEITNNEEKKRIHKDQLISIVKIFLIAQFCILFILLFGVISMIFIFHALNNDLPINYIELIIKFVSVYITSVVVELIAMLRYIVSNVFDTSITGLVEMYRDASGKENKDTQHFTKNEQEN